MMAPISTTEQAPSGATTSEPTTAEWLHALRMAFLLAVQGLRKGKLPTQIPRTQVRLTREEFRAVLDAARTAAARPERPRVR